MSASRTDLSSMQLGASLDPQGIGAKLDRSGGDASSGLLPFVRSMTPSMRLRLMPAGPLWAVASTDDDDDEGFILETRGKGSPVALMDGKELGLSGVVDDGASAGV